MTTITNLNWLYTVTNADAPPWRESDIAREMVECVITMPDGSSRRILHSRGTMAGAISNLDAWANLGDPHG